jgi:hypothetical protein
MGYEWRVPLSTGGKRMRYSWDEVKTNTVANPDWTSTSTSCQSTSDDNEKPLNVVTAVHRIWK